MAFTSYEIKNDVLFERALERAASVTTDLTLPLTQIAQDFYKSEKAIFKLKGPGQYPDIKPATKNVKFRDFGFRYPILKRTGRLEKSVTTPSSPDSIFRIVKKRTLFLGTSVPYGVFHQSDDPRTIIPLRKFLFIGPEAKKFARGPTAGRPGRWLNILNQHVLKKLESV